MQVTAQTTSSNRIAAPLRTEASVDTGDRPAMHRFETLELGHYRGDVYFLTGFVDPEPSGGFFDPDRHASAYGVSVARSTDVGANVEVVRMDTAHGQAPHLDRLYLPTGTDEATKLSLGREYTMLG